MKRGTLPISQLALWAGANGIQYHGITVRRHAEDGGSGLDRGYAVFAERDIAAASDEEPVCLMIVPSQLVLSFSAVWAQAEHDHHLKELLEATGELAEVRANWIIDWEVLPSLDVLWLTVALNNKTPRAAILLYLLLQMTISCLDESEMIGVRSPWADYIQFMTPSSLPTSWTEDQQALLAGTSLEDALAAKIHRLRREFAHLQRTTSSIDWCRRLWWGSGRTLVTYDDWLLLDSLFRSRALGIDAAGAMVPCLDMANHSAREQPIYFDRAEDDAVVLLMPPGQAVRSGEEVTISYGNSKSAAEMLFSYGFIENNATRTSALTLNLEVPGDDPLKEAKEAAATAAPVARISWADDEDSSLLTRWESSFLWLICVNEEDGLKFEVVESPDGAPALVMSWCGHDITDDMGRLEKLLRGDTRWPLYELRAIVIMQERVQAQLQRLEDSEAGWQHGHGRTSDLEIGSVTAAVGSGTGRACASISVGATSVRAAARRLGRLEHALLEQCGQDLQQLLLERSLVDVTALTQTRA